MVSLPGGLLRYYDRKGCYIILTYHDWEGCYILRHIMTGRVLNFKSYHD